MASIDPRLIELVDTLVAVGADWLAFEIFDEIRSGRPIEETDDRGRQMHREFRSWKDDKSSAPRIRIRETVMKPIEGDEQIEFAVTYLIDRIAEAIEMTSMSLDNLNQIASQSSETSGEINPRPQTAITLGVEDREFRFTQDEAAHLRLLLPQLRTSLSEWSARVRKKEPEL